MANYFSSEFSSFPLKNSKKYYLPTTSDLVDVACNLRTCAVCRLHGAKYAVCRLHGTQSADCMVTVQTKDPSKTCDSFSKFQRNLRFSARINFLTKLPHLKENNLCLFDNGYYSFPCLQLGETMTSLFARNERLL